MKNGKSEEQERPSPDERVGSVNERHNHPVPEGAEDESERISDGQANVHDTNTELEPIDWDDFDQRYGIKLEQAAAAEEELHKEFRMLCEVCV